MTRFGWLSLTVLVGLVTTTTHALGPCYYLNLCGKLGERVYDPTTNTAASPEVMNYYEANVTLSNGVTFPGRRFSFASDVNPGNPYLGVWYIPKGVTLNLRLNNLSPTNPINLHFHGLHVKGTGQDDPSLIINPKSSYLYSIYVPRDHGTYWIHSHYHTQGIPNIAGNAIGMIIIEDDPQDREVPSLVRTAPYFNMILQYQEPLFWATPNTTLNPFVTINGVAGNPALQITAQKWFRLRLLTTGVSYAGLMPGSLIVPAGVTCEVLFIAKDGVYLRIPRRLYSPISMVFTEASRNDFLIWCDGPASSQIQMTFNSLNAFSFELQSLPAQTPPDDPDIFYQACLPGFLNDTYNDVLQSTFYLTTALTFAGFDQSNALATYNIGDTFPVFGEGYGHPFHLHMNHFQITQTDTTGWFQKGDWHDTAQNFQGNMRITRYTQLLLVHCHNIYHQETFNTYGMMGLLWIDGQDQSDAPFSASCPEPVLLQQLTSSPTTAQPTTKSPTKRPTTAHPTSKSPTKRPTTGSPTKRPKTTSPTTSAPTSPHAASPTSSQFTNSPTISTSAPSIAISCPALNSSICSTTTGCYDFNPDPNQVKLALAKLTSTQKQACKAEIGCKSDSTDLCSYTCLQMCQLDPMCHVKKLSRKKSVCAVRNQSG